MGRETGLERVLGADTFKQIQSVSIDDGDWT